MDSTKRLKSRDVVKYSILGLYSVLIIVLTIVFNYSWLDCFVAITGVMYIFLLAERSMFNFIVGFVNVACYIIVSFNEQVYGEVIFYILIDTPLSIWAMLDWRKHIEKDDEGMASKDYKVEAKQLNKKWYLPILAGLAVSTILYSLFLNAIGGVSVYWDALSTTTSILATIFMLFRYKEQWAMWIFMYGISVGLWMATGNVLMTLMSAGCCLNSIVGYYEWRRSIQQTEYKENVKGALKRAEEEVLVKVKAEMEVVPALEKKKKS